jgi:cellulose synthase/poly-beta-1,6-N-acetylglucosamine synthase-like glycosyltransferase
MKSDSRTWSSRDVLTSMVEPTSNNLISDKLRNSYQSSTRTRCAGIHSHSRAAPTLYMRTCILFPFLLPPTEIKQLLLQYMRPFLSRLNSASGGVSFTHIMSCGVSSKENIRYGIWDSIRIWMDKSYLVFDIKCILIDERFSYSSLVF